MSDAGGSPFDVIDNVLKCHESIDLLIPRRIQRVRSAYHESYKDFRDGPCRRCMPHLCGSERGYRKAVPIILDAKTQYPAALQRCGNPCWCTGTSPENFCRRWRELSQAHVAQGHRRDPGNHRMRTGFGRGLPHRISRLHHIGEDCGKHRGSRRAHQSLWIASYGLYSHGGQRSCGILHAAGGFCGEFTAAVLPDLPTGSAMVSARKWASAPERSMPGVRWDWRAL